MTLVTREADAVERRTLAIGRELFASIGRVR
jgi:hypothetical protein